MESTDVREYLNAERLRITSIAQDNKDSQSGSFALVELFRGLPETARSTAETVMAEWALSEDPSERFDGLALIDEFVVAGAIPALKELAHRLEASDHYAAADDLEWVSQIMERVGHSSDLTDGE